MDPRLVSPIIHSLIHYRPRNKGRRTVAELSREPTSIYRRPKSIYVESRLPVPVYSTLYNAAAFGYEIFCVIILAG